VREGKRESVVVEAREERQRRRRRREEKSNGLFFFFFLRLFASHLGSSLPTLSSALSVLGRVLCASTVPGRKMRRLREARRRRALSPCIAMENHSLFIAPFFLFCFVLFKPSPHPLMDPGCLVMVSPERPEMVIPADSPCDIASLFLFGAVGKEEKEKAKEKEKEKKRKESERKKKLERARLRPRLGHCSFSSAWFSLLSFFWFFSCVCQGEHSISVLANFPVLAPIVAT